MPTDPHQHPAAGPSADLGALIALGREHRAAGDLDDAVRLFTDAHRLYPFEARPLVERGAILILQGHYPQSRADYEAAQTLDPRYPGLDSYLAELYLYTGQAAAALDLSQNAASREPHDLMHRINIAHAHLLLGHTQAAVQRYRLLAPEVHPTKHRRGRDLALQDLQLLLDAGVDVPAVAMARDALATP